MLGIPMAIESTLISPNSKSSKLMINEDVGDEHLTHLLQVHKLAKLGNTIKLITSLVQ